VSTPSLPKIYLDDIHIYGETRNECLENCAYVLSKFKEQHLFCKLEKCIFFPKQFEYLGYEITYNSIKPISNKVEKLKECNTLKEYQQLCGFLNYFKNSIPAYHKHIQSISQGLRENNKKWNDEMQKDLTYFQNQINNLTLLHPFRNNSDILIISDASEKGIGASIFQIKNYEKIDNYFESNLDISKKIIKESKKCPNKIQPSRDKNQPLKLKKDIKRLKFSNKESTDKHLYTIFDYIYQKDNNTTFHYNETLEDLKAKLFISSTNFHKLQDNLEPLGFFSRLLNSTEQKYSTFDRELLGINNALNHYKYLIRNGQRIFILTDHRNLVFSINKGSKVESNRKFRLFESICQFNVFPIYIQGKDNLLADFLSRQFINISQNKSNTLESNHSVMSSSNLRKRKSHDDSCDSFSAMTHTFLKIKNLILEEAPHRIDEFYECISIRNSSKLSDQYESQESSDNTDDNNDIFEKKIKIYHRKLTRMFEKERENKFKKTRKGLEPNEESDIVITNNTEDLEKRMTVLENRLTERMNKLSVRFKNYKAYQMKSDKTKEIIQQINSFKNKINHFELILNQTKQTQNIKINNQTETIGILQNELNAIRRGLGDLPSYNESQNTERNRHNIIGRDRIPFDYVIDLDN